MPPQESQPWHRFDPNAEVNWRSGRFWGAHSARVWAAAARCSGLCSDEDAPLNHERKSASLSPIRSLGPSALPGADISLSSANLRLCVSFYFGIQGYAQGRSTPQLLFCFGSAISYSMRALHQNEIDGKAPADSAEQAARAYKRLQNPLFHENLTTSC